MTRRLSWSIILALPIALTAEARQGTQLESALAALKAKRHAPGLQTYKLAIERTYFGAVHEPTGKTTSCRATEELHFEWLSGKCRRDSHTTCINPHELFSIFDGEKTKTKFRDLDSSGKPAGEWKYGLVTGSHQSHDFQPDHWPIFLNRGVVKSLISQKYYAGHLLFDAPDNQFFVQRGGKGSSPLVIRSFPERPNQPSYFEYTIDPSKDYSVTGFSRYKEDNVKSMSCSIEMKQWQGRWAPAAWRVTYFVSGKTSQITAVTVLHYEDSLEAPPWLYEIDHPEGAKIVRSDYQRQPNKGTDKYTGYEYQIQNGELVQLSGPDDRHPSWLVRHWYWVLLALALGTLVVAARRRSRRLDSLTQPKATQK